MKFHSSWLCALTFLFAASSSTLRAQVITSAEIERGLSISGPATNGYVSPAERYHYSTGPYIYVNGSSRQIIYLDYLDRADRARKFGYAMPINPFFPEPIPVPPQGMAPQGVVAAPAPAGWFGGGFGFFRRHQ